MFTKIASIFKIDYCKVSLATLKEIYTSSEKLIRSASLTWISFDNDTFNGILYLFLTQPQLQLATDPIPSLARLMYEWMLYEWINYHLVPSFSIII